MRYNEILNETKMNRRDIMKAILAGIATTAIKPSSLLQSFVNGSDAAYERLEYIESIIHEALMTSSGIAPNEYSEIYDYVLEIDDSVKESEMDDTLKFMKENGTWDDILAYDEEKYNYEDDDEDEEIYAQVDDAALFQYLERLIKAYPKDYTYKNLKSISVGKGVNVGITKGDIIRRSLKQQTKRVQMGVYGKDNTPWYKDVDKYIATEAQFDRVLTKIIRKLWLARKIRQQLLWKFISPLFNNIAAFKQSLNLIKKPLQITHEPEQPLSGDEFKARDKEKVEIKR